MSENQKATQGQEKPADELAILKRVIKALEPLNAPARARVLNYLRSCATQDEGLIGLNPEVPGNWR